MALIALSGKIGVGKDLFCSMLKAAISYEKLPDAWKTSMLETPEWEQLNDAAHTKHSGYQTKRWAGALKQIVAILIGCTVEQLEDREFKESYLGEEWNLIVTTSSWGAGPTIRPVVKDGPVFMHDHLKRYTVRQLLQEVGTNAIRDVIHPNAWVNALMSQYKPLRQFDYQVDNTKEVNEWLQHFYSKQVKEYRQDKSDIWLLSEMIEFANQVQLPNWIIPDTRFLNEADAVKQRGGWVFRINRPRKIIFADNDDMLTRTGQAYKNNFLKEHESETALDNYEHFDEVIINDGTLEELYEKAKQIVQKYELAK